MGRYYYKFSPEGWKQYSSDSTDLSNRVENVWHAFTTATHLNGVFGYSPDPVKNSREDEEFPYTPY